MQQDQVTIPDESLIVTKGTLAEMEDEILFKLFEECNRNKIIIAERLGISRVTVWNKLKQIEEKQERLR